MWRMGLAGISVAKQNLGLNGVGELDRYDISVAVPRTVGLPISIEVKHAEDTQGVRTTVCREVLAGSSPVGGQILR